MFHPPKGIPSLGVKVNNDKTKVNYAVPLLNKRTGEVETLNRCNNASLFPWCGLLINTTTCEICLDYDRFSGTQAFDNVAIHRSGNEGTNLRKKMKDFVKPRCHQQLLFNSSINSVDTVRVNFYQTFLLCAIKTVHYVRNGSGDDGPVKHCQFIYDSACDTIQFAFVLLSSKSMSYQNMFQLKWKEVLWLGRHAFHSALKRAGKQFRELCNLFAESRDVILSNRLELIAASKRALELFPMDGFAH